MRPVALICLLLGASSAHAASWTDFAPAFPTFPCADGWVACRVDGEVLNPEPAHAVVSTHRVDFLTLQPTGLFDVPGAGLSDYLGPDTGTPAVAAVAAVAVEAPPAPPVERAIPIEGHPQKSVEVPRVTEAPVDPVADAQARERVDPDPLVRPPDRVIEVAPPAVAVATQCANLVALEPKALMGRLTDDEVGCIEASLQASERQTDKEKASLVLLNQYWRTDKRRWEVAAKRHIDEIDASDPDIAYLLARYNATRGVGRADQVVRYVNLAEENKLRWGSDVYARKVYELHKMRSAAVQAKWQAAEERHVAAPTDATARVVETERNATKVAAREWYEYAESAKLDSTVALQLCVSAAGHAKACTGE